MKAVLKFLMWMWQFPQNYLACLISGALGSLISSGGTFYGRKLLVSSYIWSNFSLGDYIFVVPGTGVRKIRHEYGHSCQSRILGWLYIPVIVIPSALHNLYVRIARKLGKDPDYYSFYTERWAEHFGRKTR